MAVVVVQRHPEYWTWFIHSAIPKIGTVSGILIAIDKANVLPANWGNLCFAIGTILAAFTVQYAASAQPPRVPLTQGQAGKLAEAQAKDAPAPAEPPVIQGKSILLLLFLVGVSSCGPASKQVLADVKTCAEDNAQAAISNLYPTVTTIVTSDVKDWETQLGALGKEFGPFLICTVMDVYRDFRAKMPKAPVKGEIDPALVRGVTRAATYLNAHGIKP